MVQFKSVTFYRAPVIAGLLAAASSFFSTPAFAWGERGHQIIMEAAFLITDPATYTQCHVTQEELLAHVNDPDQAWKNQRFAHPDEPRAHFFHVNKQPADWKTRDAAKDPNEGYLVYRILKWEEEAKTLRSQKKWKDLAQNLYGLSHYLGDLTMPLHLHDDHDAEGAGMQGLHSQFESKLVSRYAEEIRATLRKKLRDEGVPVLWQKLPFRQLVMDTAEQSFTKVDRLLNDASYAYKPERKSKSSKKMVRPQFSKATLWKHTGTLAVEQLALAARLVAHAMHQVCK